MTRLVGVEGGGERLERHVGLARQLLIGDQHGQCQREAVGDARQQRSVGVERVRLPSGAA